MVYGQTDDDHLFGKTCKDFHDVYLSVDTKQQEKDVVLYVMKIKRRRHRWSSRREGAWMAPGSSSRSRVLLGKTD
ncbi:hypothetical protein E4U55_003028 [Claviceps digitariae]|nr:hypothetical protein E4U55_003028 [Claviceps digitariae]